MVATACDPNDLGSATPTKSATDTLRIADAGSAGKGKGWVVPGGGGVSIDVAGLAGRPPAVCRGSFAGRI